MERQGRFRLGLVGLLIALLLGLGAYALYNGGVSVLMAGSSLPQLGEVPAFSLQNHRGNEVTKADWQGSVVVVNFIYSRCAEACPLSTAHMLKLQSVYADETRVQLVSISVDPAYDTPEILSRYAAKLGVRSPRWSFLTGEKEAIYRLARNGFRLGVLDPNDAAQTSALPMLRSGLTHVIERLTPAAAWAHSGEAHRPIQHSARLVVVDRQGRIRQYYDSTTADILKQLQRDVDRLLRG